jgi:hypothetical protein
MFIIENLFSRSRETPKFRAEPEFAKEVISERARFYCLSVVEGLRVELDARALPDGKLAYVLLLVQPVLQQCLTWLNESILLHKIHRHALTMSDMYRKPGRLAEIAPHEREN